MYVANEDYGRFSDDEVANETLSDDYVHQDEPVSSDENNSEVAPKEKDNSLVAENIDGDLKVTLPDGKNYHAQIGDVIPRNATLEFLTIEKGLKTIAEFKYGNNQTIRASIDGKLDVSAVLDKVDAKLKAQGKNQSEKEAIKIGAAETLMGIGFIAGGSGLLVATNGMSKEGAQAVVLGIQMFGIGVATLATKEIIMNPINFFIPPEAELTRLVR